MKLRERAFGTQYWRIIKKTGKDGSSASYTDTEVMSGNKVNVEA